MTQIKQDKWRANSKRIRAINAPLPWRPAPSLPRDQSCAILHECAQTRHAGPRSLALLQCCTGHPEIENLSISIKCDNVDIVLHKHKVGVQTNLANGTQCPSGSGVVAEFGKVQAQHTAALWRLTRFRVDDLGAMRKKTLHTT